MPQAKTRLWAKQTLSLVAGNLECTALFSNIKLPLFLRVVLYMSLFLHEPGTSKAVYGTDCGQFHI